MRNTVSLKNNRDFRRIYARACSSAGACVVLFLRKNRLGHSRLGITVSGKLGNAVRRNRMRRRIKEAYRLSERKLPSGYDIVIVARERSYDIPFENLKAEIVRLYEKNRNKIH